MSHQITRSIHIPVSDGTQMPAFLAVPESRGEIPGVIVLQEIFGVNSHIKDIAKRIAQLGCVAIAPELFHRTAPGFHSTYDDFGPGQQQVKAMTTEGVEADLKAAYQYLVDDPHVRSENIAVIGFCMGGRLAFLANSLAPLRAAVSFYGRGIVPGLADKTRDQHGSLLLFWGGRDKSIPLSEARAVEDSLLQHKKDFTSVWFDYADHGFFCDERASYHPAAAHQAWALATAFLKDRLQIIEKA